MTAPLVSILITAYQSNQQYLRTAITSALQQDYSPLEIIVVDDGTNPPLDIGINDNRICHQWQPHEGLPMGLHNGMKIATGKYVAILDHDDRLTPGSITARVEALEDTGYGLAYGNIEHIDKDGIVIGTQQYRAFPSRESFLHAIVSFPTGPVKHSAIMFQRENVLEAGNYNPTMKCWFDNDLIMRVVKRNGAMYVQHTTVQYRNHSSNTSSSLLHRLQGIPFHWQLINTHVKNPVRRLGYKMLAVGYGIGKGLLFSITRRHRISQLLIQEQ